MFKVASRQFQLFRDLIKRYLCCCWYKAEHQTTKKVQEAQERLRRASQNFLGTQIAIKPSSILVHQIMGPNQTLNVFYDRHYITEPIIEVGSLIYRLPRVYNMFRNVAPALLHPRVN